MNQVNPLHIGALLLVVIMFLFFKLSGVKEELVEAKVAFGTSEKLALDLQSLKAVYANKKKTKISINRILAQSSIRAAKLILKRDKNSILISSASMDTSTLNSLMGKILNGSYNIVFLDIKKLNETKASLKMEIKW